MTVYSVCFALLFIPLSAFTQPAADTAFVYQARQYVVSLHEKALGPQSRLFNGSRYAEPEFTYDQHPFFLSEDWLTGAIAYDGEYFEDVLLMFDLMNQAVVTEHGPSGHAIQLVPSKIGHFSIAGRNFVNIDNASVQHSLPSSGFYEVLYDGRSQLIARRQKIRHEKVESLEVIVTYESRSRYFILLNGVYFPVRSKGSMLKLMDDKRPDLKRALKQQGIDFRRNREVALISLATHYDSLP